MNERRANTTAGFLFLVAVLVGVLALVAPGAANAAQGPPEDDPPHGPPDGDPPHGPPDDCDPYPDGCGSTTTTEPEGGEVTCGVSLETAVADAEVTATVRNVPPGGTVRILLDGEEMVRGTNDSGVQSIRSMPAQTNELVLTFSLPELEPGSHSIVAVGDTFSVTCGGGDLEILGSSSVGGDGNGGGGALAFTGATILTLVLIALALLGIGYYLVRRFRDRDGTATA